MATNPRQGFEDEFSLDVSVRRRDSGASQLAAHETSAPLREAERVVAPVNGTELAARRPTQEARTVAEPSGPVPAPVLAVPAAQARRSVPAPAPVPMAAPPPARSAQPVPPASPRAEPRPIPEAQVPQPRLMRPAQIAASPVARAATAPTQGRDQTPAMLAAARVGLLPQAQDVEADTLASGLPARRMSWGAMRAFSAVVVALLVLTAAERALLGGTQQRPEHPVVVSSALDAEVTTAEAPDNAELLPVLPPAGGASSREALTRFASDVARASTGTPIASPPETLLVPVVVPMLTSPPQPVPEAVQPASAPTSRSPLMAAVSLAEIPGPQSPAASWTDEAAAAALGFVAALHAHDCGYMARRVAFPAEMDGMLASGPGDVIPPGSCDPAAAGVRPLEVLHANGLRSVRVQAVHYSNWQGDGPIVRMAALGARADDVVVTLSFERQGEPLRADLLMTRGEAGAMVKGYWN